MQCSKAGHLRFRGMKAGATPFLTVFHSGWEVDSEKRLRSILPCTSTTGVSLQTLSSSGQVPA